MTPRPMKCWAVVGRKGHVMLFTVSTYRSEAIAKFLKEWTGYSWADLRREYSVVRCVLSVEARDG